MKKIFNFFETFLAQKQKWAFLPKFDQRRHTAFFQK